MADQATGADAEIKADLRQLRGLARTGFATDDDDLMLEDQLGNVGPPFINRQIALELRLRQLGATFEHCRLRTSEQSREVGIQFFALFSG